jgi:hypothetical protein
MAATFMGLFQRRMEIGSAHAVIMGLLQAGFLIRCWKCGALLHNLAGANAKQSGKTILTQSILFVIALPSQFCEGLAVGISVANRIPKTL